MKKPTEEQLEDVDSESDQDWDNNSDTSGMSGDEVVTEGQPAPEYIDAATGKPIEDVYGDPVHLGAVTEVGTRADDDYVFPKRAADYALLKHKDGNLISAIRIGTAKFAVLTTVFLQKRRITKILGRPPTGGRATELAHASHPPASTKALGKTPALPSEFTLAPGLAHGFDTLHAKSVQAGKKKKAPKAKGGVHVVRISNGRSYRSLATWTVVCLGQPVEKLPAGPEQVPNEAKHYTILSDGQGSRVAVVSTVAAPEAYHALDTNALSNGRVRRILSKAGTSDAQIAKFVSCANKATVAINVAAGRDDPDPLGLITPAERAAFTAGGTLHLFDTFVASRIVTAVSPKRSKKVVDPAPTGKAAPSTPQASKKRAAATEVATVTTPLGKEPSNAQPPCLKRARTATQIVSSDPVINELIVRPLKLVVEPCTGRVTSEIPAFKGVVDGWKLRA
ncbi:MAG: hypothetical protein VW491_06520 [Gammaproteobacteria bacterium]